LTATAKAVSQVSARQRERGEKRWDGVPPKKRSKIMQEVANQRWEGLAQTEATIRQYFQTAPLKQILDTYAIMRKQFELAGKELDNRVQADRNQEVCASCGKEILNGKWHAREPFKDPITGVMGNIFSCSYKCWVASRSGNREPLVNKY
jgi:hypothetical protein